jgi:uncharacterized membrane protein YqjE
MTRRYDVQWPLLFLVLGVLVGAPLVVWLVWDANVLLLALATVLVLAVGGGAAGLRQWLGVDPSDFAQDEMDQQFERPRDEGGLL